MLLAFAAAAAISSAPVTALQAPKAPPQQQQQQRTQTPHAPRMVDRAPLVAAPSSRNGNGRFSHVPRIKRAALKARNKRRARR